MTRAQREAALGRLAGRRPPAPAGGVGVTHRRAVLAGAPTVLPSLRSYRPGVRRRASVLQRELCFTAAKAAGAPVVAFEHTRSGTRVRYLSVEEQRRGHQEQSRGPRAVYRRRAAAGGQGRVAGTAGGRRVGGGGGGPAVRRGA